MLNLVEVSEGDFHGERIINRRKIKKGQNPPQVLQFLFQLDRTSILVTLGNVTLYSIPSINNF
jgi:hypothetical protein